MTQQLRTFTCAHCGEEECRGLTDHTARAEALAEAIEKVLFKSYPGAMVWVGYGNKELTRKLVDVILAHGTRTASTSYPITLPQDVRDGDIVGSTVVEKPKR